jgi:carotenoid cleavage dioxygenase-like enzyme
MKQSLIGLGVLFLSLGSRVEAASQVHAELEQELTMHKLESTGSIPSWVMGSFVRNGPVGVAIEGSTSPHWYDGLAMLHAFEFNQGQVYYTNRFLRTEAYESVFKYKSLEYRGVAQERTPSYFEKFVSYLYPTRNTLVNANSNVAKLAGAYAALTDIPSAVLFDLTTLETQGVLEYDDRVSGSEYWESTHPHDDPRHQQTLHCLSDYGLLGRYILYSLDYGSAVRKVIAKIAVEELAYMHSFALTEHYIILTENPFTARPADLQCSGTGFLYNFSWHPDSQHSFLWSVVRVVKW